MKRHVQSFIFIFIFYNTSIAQVKGLEGKYSYSGHGYYESIVLKTNGQFDWVLTAEFLKLFVSGNWQLRSDSIILDSYPQKDKLVVWESIKSNIPTRNFIVSNKQKGPINYSFFAISDKNDTLLLRNQWKQTTLSSKIKSFYLKDSKGLVSPTYNIKGEKTNIFHIFFETSRVFENESWRIIDEALIPKGFDGITQKYTLIKK